MRAIDADALKDYIDAQEGRPFIGCTVGQALKIMTDEQPTIQPEPLQPWEVLAAQVVLPHPEIVRCKDCKYAEYIDDVKTLWCTECGQGRTVAPDDYCSYAKMEVTT